MTRPVDVPIRLIYPDAREQDSIADHGRRLRNALMARGVSAETAGPSGLRERSGYAIVQYNPFAYGRRGFAPGLIRAIRGAPIRVGIFVHEPYVPLRADRTVPMALWQRVQLALVCRWCDLAIGASEAWQRRAARIGRLPAFHLPVGSNVPDRSGERERMRQELGIADGAIVVAQFGTPHDSRMNGHSRAAIRALEEERIETVLLNLGKEAPALRPVASREIRPGLLSEERLAEHLAAADIFLSPCVDGVTTRRTSVMAALQHGIPVVGTRSDETDTVLADARGALALTPVGEPEAMAAEVTRLARDPTKRRSGSAEARGLFEREFAWPVIAERLVAILEHD